MAYVSLSSLSPTLKQQLVRQLGSTNFRTKPSQRKQVTTPSPFYHRYQLTGRGDWVYSPIERFKDLSYEIPAMKKQYGYTSFPYYNQTYYGGGSNSDKLIRDAMDEDKKLVMLDPDGTGPAHGMKLKMTEYDIYVSRGFAQELQKSLQATQGQITTHPPSQGAQTTARIRTAGGGGSARVSGSVTPSLPRRRQDHVQDLITRGRQLSRDVQEYVARVEAYLSTAT